MIVNFPYDRERAVEYARRWALSRNPLFADFTGRGGNCTNFVSQCLLAGISVMDFTPTFGWYYRSIDDRAPAWSGVDELYDFLTDSGDFAQDATPLGPYGEEATSRDQIMIGDVIQLQNRSGQYYHTLIISEILPNDILVCAQSDDALERPLSTYNFASLRIIHILGGTIELASDDAFLTLLNGTAIKSIVSEAKDVSAQ